MSGFVDRMLVQLSDPTEFSNLLSPASDTNHSRLRVLINSVYDLSFARLHSIQTVQLISTEFQRPLFPLKHTSGTWTQTQPAYDRTDVLYNEEDRLLPVWLDIFARLGLTLVLEVDAGRIESVLTRHISQFNTLDDFRNNFQIVDLDAFMAKHNLTTVDDLREAFHYLVTEIRLQAPPSFDPNSPANQFRYHLDVAVLFRDSFDLSAALRDAKLMRSILERTVAYRGEILTADVRTPYAIVVLFPFDSIPTGGLTEAAVVAFFAAQGILAVFVTPT